MIGVLSVSLGFVLFKLKFTNTKLTSTIEMTSNKIAGDEEIEDCYADNYYDSMK